MDTQLIRDLFPKATVVRNDGSLRIAYRAPDEDYFVETFDGKQKGNLLLLVKTAKEISFSIERNAAWIAFDFGFQKGEINILPPKEKVDIQNIPDIDVDKIDPEIKSELLNLNGKYDRDNEDDIRNLVFDFLSFEESKLPIVVPPVDKIEKFQLILKSARELHRLNPVLEVDSNEPDKHGYTGSVEIRLDLAILGQKRASITASYKAKDSLEKMLTLCSEFDFEIEICNQSCIRLIFFA